MKDLMNRIHPNGARVATISDNTVLQSGIVDMKGYDSLTFLIAAGTLADADATFAVTIAESNDSGMSGSNAVAAADLIGTTALANFQFDDDNEPRKLGYKGSKRYVQLTVTPSNNTGSAPLAIIPVLGHPHLGPTANPPA